MKDIEWLFVPSHWVRVFAFLFGVGARIPGVYALVKTGSGQQGDITLAIGILMVTAGGMLLFIAFHNLPTDVKDLGGLLGYVSQGIRTGSAPASGNAPLFAAGTPEAVQNAAQNAVSRPRPASTPGRRPAPTPLPGPAPGFLRGSWPGAGCGLP